jgi:hypothetical protein
MRHNLEAHGMGCWIVIVMIGLSIYAVLHIAGVAA